MSPEQVPVWITLIERVGVPVAALAFVLLRLDRRLLEVQRAVTGLTLILADQAGISIERIEMLTGQHPRSRAADEKTRKKTA